MTTRAFDLAASTPWAITPEGLRTVLAVADRAGEDPEALATRLGRPLERTYAIEMRDGVAVVPVVGPIFRHANLFVQISGATSTQFLASDIQAAIDNSDVRAIVLNIDSPGGELAGIHELGELIFAARARKPVYAYAGGQCASGAYWIASAAERILVDPTALVGSIGVVVGYRDTRERDRKEGIDHIEIVSSQSPDKRLDPATDEGRAKAQRLTDELAQVFVERVARNRNVSAKTVVSDFGRGGLLVGASAVRAGLVDRLGSFEGLLGTFTQGGGGPWVADLKAAKLGQPHQERAPSAASSWESTIRKFGGEP